jgi:hypothetical protein
MLSTIEEGMMSRLLRAAEQQVTVERGQFALCDSEIPFEDDPWALPDLGGHQLAVSRGGVMVASTVAAHDTVVRLEVWDGQPQQREGAALGEGKLEVPSGAVFAWSVPHGPAGDPLELDGAGTYDFRVVRFGGGSEAQARQQAATSPLFTGLERYEIQMWRCSASQ